MALTEDVSVKRRLVEADPTKEDDQLLADMRAFRDALADQLAAGGKTVSVDLASFPSLARALQYGGAVSVRMEGQSVRIEAVIAREDPTPSGFATGEPIWATK